MLQPPTSVVGNALKLSKVVKSYQLGLLAVSLDPFLRQEYEFNGPKNTDPHVQYDWKTRTENKIWFAEDELVMT